jgi:hypothetical protein
VPSGRMRKEPTQLRLLTLAGGKGAAPEEAGGIGRACVREVPRPAVAHVVVAVDLRRAPALHFPRTRITWHAMSDINCATTRSMQHSRATRGINHSQPNRDADMLLAVVIVATVRMLQRCNAQHSHMEYTDGEHATPPTDA